MTLPAVHLERVREYTGAEDVVAALLDRVCSTLRPGDKVLVKPNLVSARNARLSCTHPAVVTGTCSYLRDHRVRVTVADSPAFGSAQGVADAAGMTTPLAGLGLRVKTLDDPVPIRVGGTRAGISRAAMEADLILNLPRLKAHSQMRVTAGVKNLFGCVCGLRKAVLHATHGDKGTRFEALIVDVMRALPPQVTIVDAVTAMHGTGPIDGEEYQLGLLAASGNTVAVDSTMYGILGLSSRDVPLWSECLRRGFRGADPEEIEYPMVQPGAVRVRDFLLPEILTPQSFSPPRLVLSGMRRLWNRCVTR